MRWRKVHIDDQEWRWCIAGKRFSPMWSDSQIYILIVNPLGKKHFAKIEDVEKLGEPYDHNSIKPSKVKKYILNFSKGNTPIERLAIKHGTLVKDWKNETKTNKVR